MPESFNPRDDTIDVVEVVDPATLTEITVPLSLPGRPEVTLLRAIADHLDGTFDRLPVLAINIAYMTEPFPNITAGVITGPPFVTSAAMDELEGPVDPNR